MTRPGPGLPTLPDNINATYWTGRELLAVGDNSMYRLQPR